MMEEPSVSRNMQAETYAFLALGSNLGDRIGHLRRAVDALRDHEDLDVVATSPVYESEAHVSRPGERQPDFLNAVIMVCTGIGPHDLLNVCHHVELKAGRKRVESARWSPRTLDVDLLIFGQEVVRDRRLKVPHPRMWERRFVLRPLAELAPDQYVPAPYDTTVAKLLDACPDDGIPVRIAQEL